MQKYLLNITASFMLGIFLLFSVVPCGFSAFATEIPIPEFDIKGEISCSDELSPTTATVTVAVSGEDAAKIQSITLSDGQKADFSVEDGKVSFSVKDNGTYSAKLILTGDEEIAIDQTVSVKCIDRAAPVIKSAEYDDGLISKGSLPIRVYTSEYVTKGCDKAYGKISRVYLTDSKGTKISETNTSKNGYYTLEVSKNGTYLVYAEDIAGNISNSYTVKVDIFDREAPVIKVTSIDYSKDDDSLFEVIFTVEDDSLDKISVTAKEDDSSITYKKEKKSYSFIVSKNGIYIINAVDKAGNQSNAEAKVELKDKVAPVITFKNADSEQFGKDTVKVSYTISDPNGFTLIYINGESVNDFKKEDTEYLGSFDLKIGKTLEVMAYDSYGNVAYDSVTNTRGNAELPVITSLEVSDITDNSAKASLTLEKSEGMKIKWYILEPDGRWNKLAGSTETIDIYGLKRHSDYTVKAEVTNSDGASDDKSASFTTLSMGTIRESDDSWMTFVAIGIISCVVIAMTIFIIIFVKNRKSTEKYYDEDE